MKNMVKVVLILSVLMLGSGLAEAVQVTFNVNMNVQIFRGNFDPETDQVCVRGNFNDWGLWGSGQDFLLNDADEDGIYTGVASDTETGNREFKYVVRLDGDGGNIIDPFIQRNYTIEGDNPITLPVVFFADDDGSGESTDIEVMFTVNMAVQLLQGAFDPATDAVVMRGDTVPLQWGGITNPMTVDAEDANLYHLELQFDNVIIGDDIQYKFVIVRDWETSPSDVWELPDEPTHGGNRFYVISGGEEDTDDDGYGEVDMGEVFWSDIDFNEVTEHDITVTFTVDTRPAYLKWADPDSFIVDVHTGDVLVDPISGFQVSGSFNDWPWGDEFTEDDQLWDDGENGDETAVDSFYTFSHTFPAGSVFEQAYKYAINGLDAEARSEHDHNLTLSNDVSEIAVVDTFGVTDLLYARWVLMLYPDWNDVEEGNPANQPNRFQVAQNYPNPFNPTTTIEFSMPTAAPVKVTVFDLQGREVFARHFGTVSPGQHAFVFDGSRVASGTYFYRVEAGKWNAIRKMQLVK